VKANDNRRGKLKLVSLPARLRRKDLERRLPIPGSRFIDLTGRKFERCSVEGFAGFLGPRTTWLCRCVCGRQFITRGNGVAHRPISCGCAGRGVQHHGGSYLPEYNQWRSLRLHHPDKICERWQDFETFRKDMGPKPKKFHVIGRFDRLKPYGPGNCKWMTRRQARSGR
jgi:hypothetical protein